MTLVLRRTNISFLENFTGRHMYFWYLLTITSIHDHAKAE